MSENIDFPPLRNGLDYLQDAVERLCGTPGSRDLKYAVLHLHAGIEVLVKFRLICDDWRLVLTEESAGTTEQQFNEGEFRSIGVGLALKRLQELDGITFSASQKKAAVAVERLRNQFQHHGLTSTTQAVEAQSAKALAFIVDFLDKHVRTEPQLTPADRALFDQTLPGIRALLGKIAAFVEHRMERIRPALDAGTTWWCPDCGQLAVLAQSAAFGPPVAILAHTEPRCAFCTRQWPSRAEYMDAFTGSVSLYEAVTTGGEPPTEPCPDCGQDLLVWFDPDTGELAVGMFARCFGCQAEFDDRCWRCNRPAVAPAGKEEGTVCGDCWDEMMSGAE